MIQTSITLQADWREGDYMWLLFKIQQHFAHREVWNGVYRTLSHTQPLCQASHEQAMVELRESWQELFDKRIQVKRRAQRALEATSRDKGVHTRRGYEEQPPADTLIPPTIPAREESRGEPEKKVTKGHSLPKRNGGSPSTFPNEKSQAEACHLAVEAVHRITGSCSSFNLLASLKRKVWLEVNGIPRMMDLSWTKEGPEP